MLSHSGQESAYPWPDEVRVPRRSGRLGWLLLFFVAALAVAVVAITLRGGSVLGFDVRTVQQNLSSIVPAEPGSSHIADKATTAMNPLSSSRAFVQSESQESGGAQPPQTRQDNVTGPERQGSKLALAKKPQEVSAEHEKLRRQLDVPNPSSAHNDAIKELSGSSPSNSGDKTVAAKASNKAAMPANVSKAASPNRKSDAVALDSQGRSVQSKGGTSAHSLAQRTSSSSVPSSNRNAGQGEILRLRQQAADELWRNEVGVAVPVGP